MKDKIIGSILLIVTSIIWGCSFVVMKDVTNTLTPNVLLFVRFSLASLFMFVIFFKQIKTIKLSTIKYGLIIGVFTYIAYIIQTYGLVYTTPSKNAFLTTVYTAMVPFLVWLIYKKRPDSYNFLAAFICFIGIGFVSLKGDLSMNIGDLLTIICGLFYALQIIFTKKSLEVLSPVNLSFISISTTAILALLSSILFENITIVDRIGNSYLQIIYLALISTVLTQLFQSIGQHKVSECYASILMSLESVFGVIASVLFYHEVISIQMYIGFILIFIGIIISNTKLSFLRRKL